MPLGPPPPTFCCSLLIMTSSDSGEQGRRDEAGWGELVCFWRPLFRDVFNYNFKKSLLCGFGAFKFLFTSPRH